ncbi:MAG TPA: threonine--tRNA ligase [candidate division WOR-3 bacterium]|uniref:Threonine--tRNA ligase n=1 Tax=candidate division WOR-3 bacterium TaxID=2052148 RepID=A0A7C5DGD9_UNCW3|nr:threonine--tRNA ligase [candidate division WOR-3 bacterium]
MIKLVFKGGAIVFDGSSPTTIKEIVAKERPDLFREYIAANKNGEIIDFHIPVKDGEFKLIPFDEKEGLRVLWHSASHILAQAVLRLFPDAKPGIGPAIENGFYYDFYLEKPFTPDDLDRIEKEMQNIIKEDYTIKRESISKREARKLFVKNKFKIELINEIEGDSVTIYSQGEFVDLCRGPHILSTGKVGFVKLLSVASAYWRGDEEKESMQRIYGIAFRKKEILKEYIKRQEEAKRYDHRVLGKELGIFGIYEEAGPGLIFWHPNGAIIRREIENFWINEHIKRGYQLVYTPHIARSKLWEISGHLEFYKDNMYIFPVDEEDYVVKPMNCPGHILIYKSKIHSYRDLPVRFAELGTVYRRERSGVLHGMLRVRGFTQDDGHIFCTPEQLNEEILKVFDLSIFMMETFGYKDYKIDLSVRDPLHKEKYAGNDDDWEMAESALAKALKNRGYPYKREEGEAVFYGPKIDIKLLDAFGREWQGPTIQFDFNLAKRFDVFYIGEDGNKHNVYLIHRALLGSMERFIGGLIEHYKGAFPLWLSPIQVKVLTVTEDGEEFALEIYNQFLEAGIRVELDIRNEKIGKKIREAEVNKIPYMVIIGKKEKESREVSVREHKKGDIGNFTIENFIVMLKEKIIAREVSYSKEV